MYIVDDHHGLVVSVRVSKTSGTEFHFRPVQDSEIILNKQTFKTQTEKYFFVITPNIILYALNKNTYGYYYITNRLCMDCIIRLGSHFNRTHK